MKYRLLYAIFLVCCMSVTYASETQKPVNLKQLHQIIEQAERLVVKDPINALVQFESEKREDLSALKNSLVIERPETERLCLCVGNPVIYFYKGDKELGALSYISGNYLRFSHWSSDASVVDTDKLLTWFDDRGMPWPRQMFDKQRKEQVQNQKNEQRWLGAMPSSISAVWTEILTPYGTRDAQRLMTPFTAAIPDKRLQVLALLEWYGSGAGPWSGYPSYEDVARKMLFDYTTANIISIINSTQLNTAQTEGAARFFGGWEFSQKRPDDLEKVPDTLKEQLWEHVSSTMDKDKLARARRAFKK
ncbi:hypothetical protein PRUB_b0321 [Pseudoalteromonas rubra]|uniref:Uncharacterized protein n=1 Tax=Pseudoalteromonas rubra TaxID=43658 RepID=A0A8T0BZG5_9GAMM|nr:hypothetical protein [Pseudoalteromonas rubra]KAF7781179.1 hypothetical protein PRUB_b0321 [Pseudoalteromonas rubra]